jgi:biotin carboxylase
VLALKEIDVRGDIRTTVEYLIKLLETPEFKVLGLELKLTALGLAGLG